MKREIEEARLDDELWVIMDCRWASRGYNSEQGTIFVMNGRRDKVHMFLKLETG